MKSLIVFIKLFVMKNAPLLFLVFCLWNLTNFIEVSGQGIDMSAYDDFLNNINTHTSLDFDVTLLQRRIGSSDTIKIQAHVFQVKQQDTLFGGQLFFDLDTMWVGYNGENIILGYPKSSELIYFDPAKDPSAHIKATDLNELYVGRFFQQRDFIKAVLADSSFKVTFIDTSIENVNCLAVRVNFPYYIPDVKNEKLILSFHKKNGFYHRNIHSLTFQREVQYREWTFSNIRLDHELAIPGLASSVLATYKHVKYDTVQSELKKLTNGAFIKGGLLREDHVVSLEEDTAKLILLDFWFSSCYACIKSIGIMNQIHQKYGPGGLKVYGVNIIDVDPASERISRFIKSNPMSYPTIMLNPDLKTQVPELVYPTMMILDRDRNVIYEHKGYNDHLFEDISVVIEQFLHK